MPVCNSKLEGHLAWVVLGAGATYPRIPRYDRAGLRSFDVKAVSSDIAVLYQLSREGSTGRHQSGGYLVSLENDSYAE